MNNSKKQLVRLKSGVRLHIQVIDPTGVSGYKLGGIGLSLKKPSFEVIVTTSETVSKKGFVPDTKYLREIKLEKNASIDIENLRVFIKSKIPKHTGLGSGTIYRTLIRKGIQEIFNLSDDIFNLSSLTGVGQYTVLNGGLVIVSPVPKDNTLPADVFDDNSKHRVTPNLIGSFKIPSNWHAILCVPKDKNVSGLSGKKESEFYNNLVPPKVEDLHIISFEIITKLIPAVLNQDFDKFEESLGIITSLGWKKAERELFQDYWNKTSTALYNAGAKFVGTTSSGPTSYTILDASKNNIGEVKNHLEMILGSDSEIITSQINNSGFTVQNL